MGLITAAVIGGAAAIGAGAIAASGAKKAAQTQAESQKAALSAQERAAAEAKDRRDEAVRLKQEAAKNIKFPSFLDIPEGQQFKQTLEDRIAGRGLIDVQAATSPVAAQIRAGLKQTEAAISSTASARGLGRSTIPVAQIGEKSQAAERDIASRLAQLEIVRQEQIGQAVSQFGDVAQRETTGQQQRALFKRGGEFDIADTIANDANVTRNDQFAIANSIATIGATEAAGLLLNSQIFASGLLAAGLSFEQASQRSTDDIINAIEQEQQNRSGALVNIGTRGISSGNVSGTGIFGTKFGGKTQSEILGFPTAEFRSSGR